MSEYYQTLTKIPADDKVFRTALKNAAGEELRAAQRYLETTMCEAKRRIRGIRAELKWREQNKW